jgi:hypothetical protein
MNKIARLGRDSSNKRGFFNVSPSNFFIPQLCILIKINTKRVGRSRVANIPAFALKRFHFPETEPFKVNAFNI